MARLVHLTDIHFGTEDKAAVEAATAFVLDRPPDLVVVTGDLTRNGKPAAIKCAFISSDSGSPEGEPVASSMRIVCVPVRSVWSNVNVGPSLPMAAVLYPFARASASRLSSLM